MTDRDIELKLKESVEACTPDVLDKILDGCKEQNGQVVSFQKKKSSLRRLVAIAAAVALVIGAGVFGMFEFMTGRIVSTVAFEVNPSIELRLNNKEKVVDVQALNDDASKVLSGMNLEGTDIHTATNAIVGALLKHGYIDELANSILVSVEDSDVAHGEKLQSQLAEEINAILSGASINAAILSQYVDGAGVDAVSKEYHISHGKAALIEQILKANSSYSFEELAALSVNELNLIQSNSKNHVTGVQAKGTATDGAYIGAEKAKEAALAHAGVKASDARDWEVEMDYEYHRMVYDVEFKTANGEYEYDIDAKTGEVLGRDDAAATVPGENGASQGSQVPNVDDDDRYDDDDDDRYDDDDDDDDDRYDDDDDDDDDRYDDDDDDD